MNWQRIFWTVAMWTPITIGVAATFALRSA